MENHRHHDRHHGVTSTNESRSGELAALGFAICFPSILTFAYFVLFAGHPASASVYGIGKVIQFGFPAIWVFLVVREKIPRMTLKVAGKEYYWLRLGAGFGLAVSGLMIALALLWLKPSGFLDGPVIAIQGKIADMNVDSFSAYVVVSVFYCLCHSLLEEYYWRWFVFKRLQMFVSIPVAILVSSLGFMAHHVIVLAMFFGWASPATYLFSLCIAVGGAVWAWMYERSGSIYAPWLSHALVDAGIFLLGYLLAGELLT